MTLPLCSPRKTSLNLRRGFENSGLVAMVRVYVFTDGERWMKESEDEDEVEGRKGQ